MYCQPVIHLKAVLLLALTTFGLPESNISQLRTFEEIAQNDELASEMWNFTAQRGIFNSSETDEECLREVNENPKLIGPYLVNRTLNGTREYISESYLRLYRHSRRNEINVAIEVYDKYRYIVTDQEGYMSSVSKILDNVSYNQDEEYTCVLNSSCACVWRIELEKYKRELWIINECQNNVEEYLIFGLYLDPAVRILIMLISLIVNIIVIIIIFREKSISLEYNSVILNLVVNNILIATVYIPIGYVNKYHRSSLQVEYSYIFVEVLVISLSMASVLMLTVQRYLDVSRVLKPSAPGCRLSSLYTCIIWAWSLSVSVLIYNFDHSVVHGTEILLNFFVYTVFVSIVLVTFTSMTARKLQRAAERERTTSDLDYITGASVVFAVTVVFYSVHAPYFVFMAFERIDIGRDTHYYFPVYYRIIDLTFNTIFILYPCLNIFVLYKSSRIYRRHLRKYLFPCWYDTEETTCLTMSSLQCDS